MVIEDHFLGLHTLDNFGMVEIDTNSDRTRIDHAIYTARNVCLSARRRADLGDRRVAGSVGHPATVRLDAKGHLDWCSDISGGVLDRAPVSVARSLCPAQLALDAFIDFVLVWLGGMGDVVASHQTLFFRQI